MATTTSHADHTKADTLLGLPGAMPRKIVVTMMGAGSFFTNSILKDVILTPNNLGGELRLIDIDAARLDLAEKLMRKIVEEAGDGKKWIVRASTNRADLLPGTDYIVNAIEVSGVACVRFDNDIPLEFGVSQNIGDTIGPGGLMKAMRTLPVYIEILKDVQRLCPRAVVLNYTNPMNMMCLAAARTSKLHTVGLCHSVQGTSHMLAGTPKRNTSRFSGNARESTTLRGSPSSTDREARTCTRSSCKKHETGAASLPRTSPFAQT